MNPELIAHAAELISQADALVVAGGAGMGVETNRRMSRRVQGLGHLSTTARHVAYPSARSKTTSHTAFGSAYL